MASVAAFEGLSREELMQKVVELQQGLAELSFKVDNVKGENNQLRDENVVLKDYLNNLMAKVGKMSGLGTSAPSRVMIQHNPDGAQSVRVNDHIGELTAPAMDIEATQPRRGVHGHVRRGARWLRLATPMRSGVARSPGVFPRLAERRWPLGVDGRACARASTRATRLSGNARNAQVYRQM
eukprot:CAMPEP_0117497730 /NCGR_PEP_ID=MMETSP0784-20121206/21337_1 /TAXON_ID=39447 /ORGANISM="" /LENGTH=180 /DNA_ID=CAMNT_0005292769 /DNA_START=27 /DNA_END=570 /DNA_ORIENTATION=-